MCTTVASACMSRDWAPGSMHARQALGAGNGVSLSPEHMSLFVSTPCAELSSSTEFLYTGPIFLISDQPVCRKSFCASPSPPRQLPAPARMDPTLCCQLVWMKAPLPADFKCLSYVTARLETLKTEYPIHPEWTGTKQTPLRSPFASLKTRKISKQKMNWQVL